MTDEELLARIAKQDKAAFEELVRRYRGKFFGIASARGLSPADAEEAASDGLMQVWRCAEQALDSALPVRYWLRGVMVRMTINKFRSLKLPTTKKKKTEKSLADGTALDLDPKSKKEEPDTPLEDEVEYEPAKLKPNFYRRAGEDEDDDLEFNKQRSAETDSWLGLSEQEAARLEYEHRRCVDTCLPKLSDTHRETLVMLLYEGQTLNDVAKTTGESLGTIKSRQHYALQKMKQCVVRLLQSKSGGSK